MCLIGSTAEARDLVLTWGSPESRFSGVKSWFFSRFLGFFRRVLAPRTRVTSLGFNGVSRFAAAAVVVVVVVVVRAGESSVACTVAVTSRLGDSSCDSSDMLRVVSGNRWLGARLRWEGGA